MMEESMMGSTTVEGPFHDNIIVFDIGGTWFRSGVMTTEGKLMAVRRSQALNYRNAPDRSIHQLQAGLVHYLSGEVRRLQTEFPGMNLHTIGISMGAALNAHTGLILNSGPLWGPECQPFDLLVSLRECEPHLRWIVVNDITAALLRQISEKSGRSPARVTLITVSTGIGCRTYSAALQSIPVDRVYGIQGEIGHIPVSFEYKNVRVELRCDCGSLNHLNAFCSGRGIELLLQIIPDLASEQFRGSLLARQVGSQAAKLTFSHFAEAVRKNDPFARSILDAITLPLARIIVVMLTVDPEIEDILLVGGVVRALREKYRESLLNQLDAIGMYQISSVDPHFFHHRIRYGVIDDDSGLIGAAIAVRIGR
jgi:predicted NBD/HSP70 family sugar kinase